MVKNYELDDNNCLFNLLYGCDSQLNTVHNRNNINLKINLLNTLNNCGLTHLFNTYLNDIKTSATNDDIKIDDLKYSSAWKLGNWHLEEVDTTNKCLNEETSLDGLFYSTVSSIVKQNDEKRFEIYSNKTQNCILKELTAYDIHLSSRVTPLISRLYSLEQIKFFIKYQQDSDYNNLISNASLVNDLWPNYENNFTSNVKDFNLVDDILSVRVSILKSYLNKVQIKGECKEEIKHWLVSLYDKLIDNSIFHKRYQIAYTYLNEMRKHCQLKLQCDLKRDQTAL